VRYCRSLLEVAAWENGNITAGTQSSLVKNNLQLPENSATAVAVRNVVLEGLRHSADFFTAALPKTIFPPLFNCYRGKANQFGNHVDNAIRTIERTKERVRSDLSATLFLSDPCEYEGGELIIEDLFGIQKVKLYAGDLILYPSSSIHRVEPVTSGMRYASFFWIESMVRDTQQRRLLYELDMAILSLRQTLGDNDETIRLTGCYHNLLRMWAL
jgi:PKHD-type hydroxylase